MSKPLTGVLKPTASGRFTASVPVLRGSDRRKQHTFDTRKAATAWLAEAIRAVEAGLPLPTPSRNETVGVPHATALPAEPTSFRALGELWAEENFVEDEVAEIDREVQVRKHLQVLSDYLEACDLTVATITRRQAKEMFRFLLKTDGPAPTVELPDGLDPHRLVTKQDGLMILAQHGLAMSESSFKRARQEGKLEPVVLGPGPHLFRLGDVAVVAGRLRRPAGRPGSMPANRYARSTMCDVRRTFRRVMEYAAEHHVATQPRVTEAKLPKDRSSKVKVRPLTLQEAAELAVHLHAVHQVALWLMRIMGLRIGEAYGVRVEDLTDFGPGQAGTLKVQSQGGTKFRRRKGKDVVVSDEVDEVKADSLRVLIVPAPLMDLLRDVIAVFHTDPRGAVDSAARLVPGLAVDDKAGQKAFTAALKRAVEVEGIDLRRAMGRRAAACEPVLPTPHTLRKSVASQLKGKVAVEDVELFLGHRMGGRVIHKHYLLSDPDLKAERRIARRLTKQIDAELGGSLMIPTAITCASGNQKALAQRGLEIEAALLDLGWLVSAHPEDSLTVADAAPMIGVSEQQVRASIRAGDLPARLVPGTSPGVPRYLVALPDALAAAETRPAGSAIRQLVEELGFPYDAIRQYINRHPDLSFEVVAGRRDHKVSDHVAAEVRRYFTEQSALESRATRLPDAARALGLSVPAVKTLIRNGHLVEDIRFHGGIQSVTTASLDGFLSTGTGLRRRAS